MAAAQRIEACRHGEDKLLKFTANIRMGKRGDLSDFEHAVVDVFQKLLIYWDLRPQTISRVCRERSEKTQ